MKKKKRLVPIVDDWYIATQDNSLNKRDPNILISNSMISNPNLKLPKEQNFYENEYVLKVIIGKVNGEKIISPPIDTIKNSIAVGVDGKKFQLGSVNQEYRSFLLMIRKNFPVLYNYVIGYKDGRPYIVGNVYENKNIYTIEDTIIGQDCESFLIKLSSGKLLFVNWLSINEGLEINLRHKILHGNKKVKYSNVLFCGKKCVLDIFNTEWDFDLDEYPDVFEVPKKYTILK